MSESAIRAVIKTDLEAVTGIGKVYPRLRWTTDQLKFKEAFKTTSDVVNAWMITRFKTTAEHVNSDQISRRHSFKIVGVYGFNDEDATEDTFQALVEAVVTKFNADRDLGGAAFDSGPMQVETVEFRMFSGVLCHYAELTLEVEEMVTWAE